MVLTAYRGFSPEMADIAERFFTDRWIDAPVRPGQGAGRVLASDHAVGASLCADELSGQAARRDDARAMNSATACIRCWRRRTAR